MGRDAANAANDLQLLGIQGPNQRDDHRQGSHEVPPGKWGSNDAESRLPSPRCIPYLEAPPLPPTRLVIARESYPTVVYPTTARKLSRTMGSFKELRAGRYQSFFERLRRARVSAGLTQAEVAAKVGRPQTWVSKCELGERRVDFVEFENIAAACGKG